MFSSHKVEHKAAYGLRWSLAPEVEFFISFRSIRIMNARDEAWFVIYTLMSSRPDFTDVERISGDVQIHEHLHETKKSQEPILACAKSNGLLGNEAIHLRNATHHVIYQAERCAP